MGKYVKKAKELEKKSASRQKDKARIKASTASSRNDGMDKKFESNFHFGGRPVSFKKRMDLVVKLEEYFNGKAKETIGKDKNGNDIIGQAPISQEDLCVFLGISDETFNNYGKKAEFAYDVMMAKSICKAYLVNKCASEANHKADFILMNGYGWRNKTDNEFSGEINVMPEVKIGKENISMKIGEDSEDGD